MSPNVSEITFRNLHGLDIRCKFAAEIKNNIIMNKTFGKLKVGDYIARVEGYKVESAKVIKIDKVSKTNMVFLVKGTETKKKFTFDVENECSMFGLISGEKYYADGSIVSALRDGIIIGIEYARKDVVNSFKTMFPYFTVNGRPVEEVMEEQTT